MAKGFLLTLVTTALIAMLLKLVGAAIPSRGAAVKFAALAGLVAIVMMDFGDSVWWHISWSWKAYMAFYHLSSWVLAATVLFGFTRDPASR